MAVRIELLDGRHQRASFDCGDPRLNDFVIRLAGQQQRRGLTSNATHNRQQKAVRL
jgi:hypothetical protein